ncbi:FAD-binding domain-containing protein [Fomes fomentarius]|nr:FAD-binding domain-containing protein [Fomes fomentarius]
MENLKLKGTILTLASGEAYTVALKRNSELSVLPPAYVVQPIVFSDISSVLSYASSCSPPIEIAVKGGGAHSSTWASSRGGIIIDLSKLNKVTLAENKQSITVQGGALWEDVYKVTSEAKVDVVGSPLWFVGVGGFTLGGGYGPLSGELGLAIDNLIAATVVLADGRIVRASKTEEPDLFWAIRGGGGQFGIVVEFVFRAHPYAGPFSAGVLAYPGVEIDNILQVINKWKQTQTPAERFTMNFSRGPAPDFKPSVVILPTVIHDETGTRAQEVLAPFTSGPIEPILRNIRVVPNFLPLSHAADAALATAPRKLVIRGTMFSDFFPELLLPVWDKWLKFTENEDVRASAVLWDMTVPDAITEIKSDETALKTRVPHYWMAVQGRFTTDQSVDACRTFTEEIVQFVRNKNAELSGQDLGWFLNLCQGNELAEDVFGRNLPRLQEVKAKYDPKKVFSKGIVIEPAHRPIDSV